MSDVITNKTGRVEKPVVPAKMPKLSQNVNVMRGTGGLLSGARVHGNINVTVKYRMVEHSVSQLQITFETEKNNENE